MKKWRYLVYAGFVILAGWLVWEYREDLGLVGPHGIGSSSVTVASPSESADRPARINWAPVDRGADGFKVEMPADVKQISIPAYNEAGEAESVNMIYSNPDGATTFAVAWSDNPPVMRMNRRQAEQTLEMARDGALARTQTSLIRESAANHGGNPARDIVTRNSGGGVMDSRLIYAGDRLYMLIAVFPSLNARREQDVARFYNSFTAVGGTGIPSTLPSAVPANRN